MGQPYWDEDQGTWVGGEEEEDTPPPQAVPVRQRTAPAPQAIAPSPEDLQDAELDAVDARLAEVAYYRAFLSNPSMFGDVAPTEAEIVRRVETGFKRFAKQKIAEVMGGAPVSTSSSIFTAEEVANLKRLAAANSPAPQQKAPVPEGGRKRKPPGALPMPKGPALSMALQTQVAEKIEEAQQQNGGVSGEAAVTQMLLGAVSGALSNAGGR